MNKYLSLLFLLCLLTGLPALGEEASIEAAVSEAVVELGGGEETPKPVATVAPDEGAKGGSSEDCVIPYPDVTSKEIKKLLKPSSRVYPGKLVWPLPGRPVLKHITSHVGWRNAARIHSHQGGAWPSWLHHGIDVGSVTTKQVVVAAADGVAWANYKGGDGMYVVIDHQNGWYTEYQHLSAFAGDVTKGCRRVPVKAGDPIGYVGNSGGDYPVHFHFEIAYSPKGPGASAKKYFQQTKNRTIRAYSFPQEAVVELHWAKTWEICTAEKQEFVANVEALEDDDEKR